MTVSEFVDTFKEWVERYGYSDYYTIGTDFGDNFAVLVDEDGYIFMQEYESWRRVKTSVNVKNIVEFRKGFNDQEFFIICADDTGFSVDSDGIYFCEEGRPSGWGNAFDYFMQFPVDAPTDTLE